MKTLDILPDPTSLEVSANQGEVSLAAAFIPVDGDLTVQCTKGQIKIITLSVYEMGSIWKDSPELPKPSE